MSEREALSDAAQKLIVLINELDSLSEVEAEPLKSAADKLVLEISGHLGNIGGFCDTWSRNRIRALQRALSLCLSASWGYIILKNALPPIVGIQVDFSKMPFRAVGLKFELFGGKFRDLLEE
jgi:hypothetical protein